MLSIIRRSLTNFQTDHCPRIAAALAYYTAFAMAPMLVLVLSVCQIVFEPSDIQGEMETQIASVVGESGVEQVKTMIKAGENDKHRGVVATIVGICFMLLGATGVFAQLQSALNEIWDVKPDPNHSSIKTFLMKRLISLGMLLTIAFLLMISITASSALQAFDSHIDRWLPGQYGSVFVQVADYGISFVVITCLFASMFKVLPDAKIGWSSVWSGAAVTSFLFILGKMGVAVYAGSQNMANTYGAAGSLVLILVWVYYSAMIFLLGAEFTQVWANEQGSGVLPEDGAVRVARSTVPE